MILPPELAANRRVVWMTGVAHAVISHWNTGEDDAAAVADHIATSWRPIDAALFLQLLLERLDEARREELLAQVAKRVSA